MIRGPIVRQLREQRNRGEKKMKEDIDEFYRAFLHLNGFCCFVFQPVYYYLSKGFKAHL